MPSDGDLCASAQALRSTGRSAPAPGADDNRPFSSEVLPHLLQLLVSACSCYELRRNQYRVSAGRVEFRNDRCRPTRFALRSETRRPSRHRLRLRRPTAKPSKSIPASTPRQRTRLSDLCRASPLRQQQRTRLGQPCKTMLPALSTPNGRRADEQ